MSPEERAAIVAAWCQRGETIWHYRAGVWRWVDGDTLDVVVDLGFGVGMQQRVRLMAPEGGVDTPEMNSRDPAVRLDAAAAKAFAMAAAPAASEVLIRTAKAEPARDGFGRYLAEVITADGVNVGEELLRRGLAVPYRRAP